MILSETKVLVVDDVAANRELLARRLKRLGLELIDQAGDGVEALAAIRAKDYDVVLLDIMMPRLDGFGVLTALREEGRTLEMPVIVVSAMNEMDAVVRCIELGADDFLFKPFNPTLLRARVMASLEKKALRDQTREELRRKQWELNEARTLQLALVPPPFSGRIGDLAISIDVMLEPAKEVGGDLVDYFCVGDDLLVFLLGDVSDKGACAALTMARTHSMFRGLARRPDAVELFGQPARAATVINAALGANNSACMFVTLALASLNTTTRRLRFVRAGHIPPFHVDGGDMVTRLLGTGGPPLGVVEDFQYTEDSLELAPDSRLLVLTDGFTEAHGPDGVLYGEDRVASFMANLDARGDAPLQELMREVRAFEGGSSASDDMAAILLSLEPGAR